MLTQISDFFVTQTHSQAVALTQGYSWHLVLLSVVLAICCAWMALYTADLAKLAENKNTRRIAISSGALALGVGVWSMHFIGMLALDLCVAISYDTTLTALSLLPGILAARVALDQLTTTQIRFYRLILSGTIMGAGIGAMHYLGMAAMRMSAYLRYDPGYFLLSIVVAIVFANLSLWIRFRLLVYQNNSPLSAITISGVVMGLAIAGMHYTGMAAARFIGNAETAGASDGPDRTILALSIALITLIAGLIVLIGNAILRYYRMYQQIQENEVRLRAVVETAIDAIITTNSKGVILAVNAATARIFGWRAEQLQGQSIAVLLPEKDRIKIPFYLQLYLSESDPKLAKQGREVMALHNSGHTFPVRLAVGKASTSKEALLVGFVTDLSDKHALLQELAEREKKYRSLISNIPGAAFRSQLDTNWSKLFVSAPILEITGYTAQEFTNGHVAITDLIHPNDLSRLKVAVTAAIEDKLSWSLDYRIRHKDGRERWIKERAAAVYDDNGIAQWIDGVMLDETENKLQTAEFAGLAHAIRLAFAVVEFDMQGNILTANQKFLDLTHYRMDELVGKNHRIFCPPGVDDQHTYHLLWENLRQGIPQVGEFHRWGKGQRDIWLQAAYNPILDPDGQTRKVVKLAADVSLRKAIEVDLIMARDKAEQAASAKGMFLANMSHEIRTPMNAILGFTELLLNSELSYDHKRHLKTVRQSAISLLRLLNDILDTAKLERGALELDQQDFDLIELCEQVCDTFSVQCLNKGIQLEYLPDPNCPRFIHADELRLRQILTNLLGNGIKFTEQGKVSLLVNLFDSRLQIQVRDTGIGIPSDRLALIFAPFTQADPSMTRRFGGTGLGTTIAKQLIELMGGQISVESEVGRGSCFTVELPYLPGSSSHKKISNQEIVLPPLKILIVDDIAENLELLRIHLELKGHQIESALSGEQALTRFKRFRPELILMDVQMQGMDGFEASQNILASAKELDINPPMIIALTASVLSRDRDRALSVGMRGFATKPVIFQDLEREILRVMQEAKPAELSATIVTKTARMPDHDSPVIDWQGAQTRWPDRASLIRNMQQFLNRDWRGEWSALPDDRAIRNFAHRLRGGALNLGLLKLAAFAGKLEDRDYLTAEVEYLSELSSLLTQSSSALSSVLQNTGPVSEAMLDEDQAQLVGLLDKLIQACEHNQYDETTLKQCLPLLNQRHAAELQSTLDAFEFDTALFMLKQIRTRLILNHKDH